MGIINNNNIYITMLTVHHNYIENLNLPKQRKYGIAGIRIRQRERDRQTERQTDRQTDRRTQSERNKERQRQRETQRERDREIE